MNPRDSTTITWHPITFLPTLLDAARGTAQAAREQVSALQQATRRPGLLSEAERTRVIRVYTESASYVSIYREQTRRWRLDAATKAQVLQLDELDDLVAQWETDVHLILRLAGGRSAHATP